MLNVKLLTLICAPNSKDVKVAFVYFCTIPPPLAGLQDAGVNVIADFEAPRQVKTIHICFTFPDIFNNVLHIRILDMDIIIDFVLV